MASATELDHGELGAVDKVGNSAIRHPHGTARTWVTPAVVSLGWIVWAYFRTRPPAALTTGPKPLSHYNPWSYEAFAYSDVIALYRVHHLALHLAPYVHNTIEYPVLTGLFMWAAAFFPGVGGYFIASTVGLAASAVVCVYVLHRASPKLAWAFALCPLLLVYSLLNWDLFAIALMLLGWHFARRDRPFVAGALLSLGVFAKFFPLMLLGFELVHLAIRWREAEARRATLRMVAGSLIVAVVVNVPFAALNFKGWSHFFAFNAARGGGGGILYELRIASNWSIRLVDVTSVLIVLAVVAVLVVAVARGATPEFAAAVAFTSFMLVNKTFSPQYMLWVFVYALIAEWPMWSLVALTGAGLFDFANAMITLHLSAARDPAFAWYRRTFYNVNKAGRLIAMAATLVAGVATGSKATTALQRSRARPVSTEFTPTI